MQNVGTKEWREIEAACAAAAHALDAYRETDLALRASFLERIAEEIEALGESLIATAAQESRLPVARLEGERARTVGQLRLFAQVVRRGEWLGVRVDPAVPDRRPLPFPELRMRKIPLGPVAVFGASNFPLAFSTAGGDTASALAAGCPVIVKAHPAHPRTSLMVAGAVRAAVLASGLPEGVFGHVTGSGNEVGAALVMNPHVAAVGFTGSRVGGLALLRMAQARVVPIPVFAEMSSINPVLLLPRALEQRAGTLAREFVASMTMGAGQFCTNPGLVLAQEGAGLDAFLQDAARALADVPAAPMLTPGIQVSYDAAVARLVAHPAVQRLASGGAPQADQACQASLFVTSADEMLADPSLSHEVFGATSLVVRCADVGEMHRLLEAAEGQLTATLQMEQEDLPLARRLLPLLERKVGRIIVNGWPTGVEVAPAQVHGGPYPATADGRSTSVGSLSIERFLRPVCYQNVPAALLPGVFGSTVDPAG